MAKSKRVGARRAAMAGRHRIHRVLLHQEYPDGTKLGIPEEF